MDIQLPVLDGIVATKVIRRQERLSGIGQYPAPTACASTPSDVLASPNDKSPLDTDAAGQCSPEILAQALATAAGQPNVSSIIPDTSDTSCTNPSHGVAPPASSSGTGQYRPAVIIVALTASSFDSDRVAALAAGCNDFLNKPVDHKWLERKLIEWGSMQYLLLAGLSQPLPPPTASSSTVLATPDPVLAPKDKDTRGRRTEAARTIHDQTDRATFSHNLDRTQSRQAGLLADRLHIAPLRRTARTGSPAQPAAASSTLSPLDPPAPRNDDGTVDQAACTPTHNKPTEHKGTMMDADVQRSS